MQQSKKYCYNCIHLRCRSRLLFPEDVEPVDCKKYKDMEKIVVSKRNRDGASVWFEHVNDNVYTIKASKDYILEYAGINYEALAPDAENYDINFKMPDGGRQKAHIVSFDPSGGPYIAIGDKFEGFTVNRIFGKEDELGTFFELTKI